MMARDMPRGLFLALVAAVAVGLAMAVSQVAQPLRSVVVLWLLVGAPLLAFVLRVLKHAAHMRATAPPVAKAPAPLPAARSARHRHATAELRVIMSDSVGAGRYVVR